MKTKETNWKVATLLTVALLSWTFAVSPSADEERATGAGSTIDEYELMPGRTYHEFLHEQSNCIACHGEGPIAGYPADDGCSDCHSIDDLKVQTARPPEERWQNPHDNMHFGDTMPCVECHGEHSVKEVYCVRCHEFEYPNHKD